MALACEEQGKVSEAAECETAMPTWEAAPTIMQYMVVLLCANLERDQCMVWCSLFWFTSFNEIRSRSADSVLNDICYEEREN